MRFLKIVVILTVPFLAACQSTSTPQSVSRQTSEVRHIGVAMYEQSPTVDNIAAGHHENDYFMPLWNAYQSGQIQGVTDTVTVYLYRNGDRPWSQNVVVDGFAKFSVPRHLIDGSTSLCVEVPWKHIAHQTKAPNPSIMCADGVGAYMDAGRGRTVTDAYGVVVIKPAG